MGRLASLLDATTHALAFLYYTVRHPIDSVRFWWGCISCRQELAVVVRESNLCPDCVDTEGFCDYHLARFEYVLYKKYGYLPMPYGSVG